MSNCNCGCGCQPNVCNPQPTTPCDCAVRDLSTNCILYTGDDLEGSGIPKNTQLTDVLIMLDEYMTTAIEQKASSVITNVGTGAEIYAGINNLGKKKLRTLTSSDDSITIVQNADEIDLKTATTSEPTVIANGTITTVSGTGSVGSPYIINVTETDLVHKSISETITGAKTFTNVTNFSGTGNSNGLVQVQNTGTFVGVSVTTSGTGKAIQITSGNGTGNSLEIQGNTGFANNFINATLNSVLKYRVDSNGVSTAAQYNVAALNTAPATATSTGTTGEIRYTATHIYVCTATNTWVRCALTTF